MEEGSDFTRRIHVNTLNPVLPWNVSALRNDLPTILFKSTYHDLSEGQFVIRTLASTPSNDALLSNLFCKISMTYLFFLGALLECLVLRSRRRLPLSRSIYQVIMGVPYAKMQTRRVKCFPDKNTIILEGRWRLLSLWLPLWGWRCSKSLFACKEACSGPDLCRPELILHSQPWRPSSSLELEACPLLFLLLDGYFGESLCRWILRSEWPKPAWFVLHIPLCA